MKHVTVEIHQSPMHFYTLLAAGLLFLNACSDDVVDAVTEQIPDTESIFTVKAGGTGSDYPTNITVDADGNTYMTGQFAGKAFFDTKEIQSTGAENMFLAKFDAEGKAVWVSQGGGEKHDEGRSVKVDGDGNVYVTGYFQGSATFGATALQTAGDLDIFLAKYNASGDLLWVKKAGGEGYDRGYALDLDADGNVYVVGQFTRLAFFDASTVVYAGDVTTGTFLVKYNPSGDVVFARSSTGVSYSEGNALVVSAAGESYLSGSFTETMKFGTTTLEAQGKLDLFIAKYNADGTLAWAKREGSSGTEANRGMSLDASGNLYVTGFFEGTTTLGTTSFASAGDQDIFLAKYNTSGDNLWAIKAGGPGRDRSYAVNHDANGSLYLTGDFMGSLSIGTNTLVASGDAEIFVARISAAGDVAWSKKAGGIGEDGGYSANVDANGDVYLGAYFQDVVSFGATELTSSGDHDIVLWKFKQ
ncbi:SBBP repeat-containing protein [Chryseolinea lacunae]|uniref:SBBP repeat-containing protein n=1 Tax=Chryseolinea lacunae TaxID=2801331 RepID=A0ABS1KJY7_9BACT|nr:SBBP repeat-containing protein [Chryseolinea lacunae]MBL0739673.1 SBBP repeat-containing protein [Chryseolinea lacunae]